METTRTRIHPLMAAAAVSVIIVSAAGAAAITGLLPSSHSAPEPQQPAPAPAQLAALPAPAAAPAAAPVATAYVEPAPVERHEAPAVKHTVHHSVHHHATEVARNDEPSYRQQPAPQPAQAAPHQPNYIGIGAGALIGGIIGHQVGGGNGKKLATVAGAIGGGIIGNQVANHNQQ